MIRKGKIRVTGNIKKLSSFFILKKRMVVLRKRLTEIFYKFINKLSHLNVSEVVTKRDCLTVT